MPAILTLTMNPALDLSTCTDRVEPIHKLRCSEPVLHPGGGGINVARVVHRLGGDTLALYPAGGATGQKLSALLNQEGVPCEPLPIAGDTRESFSVQEAHTGQEYRFVMPGPTLSEREWQACLSACLSHRPDWLVLSGSLPPGVPDHFYSLLAQACSAQGIRVMLDSSGAALREGLVPGVFAIKPSLRELRELTGQPLSDDAAIVAAARMLISRQSSRSSRWVAVTLGDAGACLVTPDEAWRAPALQVEVRSAIGAGDSFVGGLMTALARGDDAATAFRLAMAASAAALMHPGTALSDPAQVQALLPQVQLQRLEMSSQR